MAKGGVQKKEKYSGQFQGLKIEVIGVFRGNLESLTLTEHPPDSRQVCKLEFVRCCPVEKKTERSICLGLVVAAR